ncbi:MAG TPA: hypothetical protein VMH22_11835 [bacterium]|nr:hypothetical protein [bacterium]
MKKGDKYVCDSCGLVLVVSDACDCADCGPVCCGEQMKVKKAKTTKKAKKR